MFWFILIIIAIWWNIYSKSKKDEQFFNILLQLKQDENADKNTIDAIIYAYTLNKNSAFNKYTILNNVKMMLFKNKSSTNNSDSNETIYPEEEIVGQTSLFDQYTSPEVEDFTQINQNTQPQYIPPTPFGYTPPTPMSNSHSTETVAMADANPISTPQFQPQFQYDYNHNPNIQPNFSPQMVTKPPKKPIDLDTSSIVLILGVILVLTSAVIFSTTIWDSVDSIFKIGILNGLGLINFLISFAFFKRFETKSPSTAFYVLGYSFVSFSSISFGYFYVSPHFSDIFNTTGWLLTLSVFASLICVFSFYGHQIYNKSEFLWISFLATDLIIFTLSKGIFNNINIVLFILSLYAVGLVYLLNFDKVQTSSNVLFDFSRVNLLIISCVAIASTQTNLFTILVCGILASGFLLSHDKQFNNDLSALSFCVIMMVGLFKSGFDSGISSSFFMLCFLPIMIFIFKIMNILDEELQKKLNTFTLIFSFGIFFFNSFYSFTATEPTLISLATLILLFISVSLLNNLNNLKEYKYVHPILLTVIIIELSRLLDYNNILKGLNLSYLISALFFAIFLFYNYNTKWEIKTHVSQNIFPLALFFTSLNTEIFSSTSSQNHLFAIYYYSLFIACYIINSIYEKNSIVQYVYSSIVTSATLLLISPIYKLIPNINITYYHIFAILIFAMAVLLYLFKEFKITHKYIIPVNVIYLLITQVAFFDNLIIQYPVEYFNYNLELIFLFIAITVLYLSQKLIYEDEYITLKYVFPFILVFNGFITIMGNVGNDIDLFYQVLMCVTLIFTVVIKPNTSFQLPFNIILFMTLLWFKTFIEDEFNYLLVAIAILSLIYQLVKSYKLDIINKNNQLYIFVLLPFMFLLCPNITIAQALLTAFAFIYIYLNEQFTDIQHIPLSKFIVNILLNIVMFTQAIDGFDSDYILPSLILSIFSLVAVTLLSNRNNLLSSVSIFSMYWLTISSIHELISPYTNYEISLVAPIYIVNIFLYLSKFITLEGFNTITQKGLFDKSKTNINFYKLSLNIPISNIDFYSFVGIIGVFTLFFEAYPCHSFIMLSLYFLNFTRRGLYDKALITASSASLSLALLTQDFITITRLYQTEYNLIIIIGFIFVLRHIWNDKLPAITYFITKIGTVVILFLDIMKYKEVFDALELGIGLILLLLYGLYLKRLRIVVLSVTSILLLITYVSFEFWNSPYWFAYLILTGIFLISLSLRIESKKRKEKIE